MKHRTRLRAVAASAMVAMLIGIVATPAQAHLPGRMTGGGKIVKSNGVEISITHGFELHCIFPEGADPIEPNNLQVNWKGNHWHLTDLTRGACSDNRELTPNPPDANFDTYRGGGMGKLNGDAGTTATWTMTDSGEPGVADHFGIVIRRADGTVALRAPLLPLTFGNQQAHNV